MSSITYSVERLLNFEGGVPVRRDLAPSILFTILLALTFPILAWRFVTAAHRSYVLGSSFMFFLTRFIALIMRAYMSRNSYNIHLVLAQSVLMTIGWLFLINALVDLMRKNVLRRGVSHATHANSTAVNTPTKSSGWITYFAHFHRLLLLASFATIVAAAAILGRRYRGIDELNNVRNLVRASYLLGLITLVVALLTTIATHFSHARSPTKSGLIIGMGVFLLVSSIYRVVATFRGYGPTNRGLAAFWVALILMEFIAYLITLAVSIPKWYHNHHDRTTRFGSDAEKLAHPAHPNTTTSHTGPAGVHTHTGTNATVPGTTGHTTTTTTTH